MYGGDKHPDVPVHTYGGDKHPDVQVHMYGGDKYPDVPVPMYGIDKHSDGWRYVEGSSAQILINMLKIIQNYK